MAAKKEQMKKYVWIVIYGETDDQDNVISVHSEEPSYDEIINSPKIVKNHCFDLDGEWTNYPNKDVYSGEWVSGHHLVRLEKHEVLS